MEQTFSKAEELARNIKDYINNRVDQVKLSSAEKTARFMAYLIAICVVVMLAVFFILFAAIAFSLFMGKVFGAMHWGFLLTGSLLLLLAFFLWMARACCNTPL